MTPNEITATNLRSVADLLDAHPDLPNPYITTSSSGRVNINWYLTLEHIGTSNQKADAAAIIKAIDGGWTRDTDRDDEDARWTQTRDGVDLLVLVARAEVCERIVVGVEEVTVPAREAIPERTETREIVEWKCLPLLADASA